MEGYGQENKDILRRVPKNYEREQVFRDLCPVASKYLLRL